jgi:peptidoglycan/LPS O-acetylase OafA/YrhL
MGILRVFLALTVCLNHYFPIYKLPDSFGLGAILAVDVFFIISGFYMALILDKKYTGPGAVGKFYLNRFLRLYPSYYLIIIAYLAVSIYLRLEKGQWIFMTEKVGIFATSGFFTRLYGVLANLFIFGQDSLFALKFCPDTASLCLGSAAVGSPPYPWQMLFIPQAWSIEVELLFYLFAPLFIKWRTKTIAWMVLILLLLKIYLKTVPMMGEFWEYRFPPLEVCLFLMGILAYRMYSRLERRNIHPAYLIAVLVAFISYMYVFQWLPGNFIKTGLVYPMALMCIPLIFKLTRKIAMDRVIGELSYPIYLMHHLVMQAVGYWYHGAHFILVPMILTVVLSFLLHHYFLRPIEAYRQRQVYTPS